MVPDTEDKLYIVLLSIHGLVRSKELELGRDADTGGQVQYVVELLKALSEHERVGRVDLFTRQIFDPKIDNSYNVPLEKVTDKANIVRLPCGPRRYLYKESLWPYLSQFIDNLLRYLFQLKTLPSIIHGHYADAGYVGSEVARILEVPFFFTGHSLGREKNKRLLDNGYSQDNIERKYNFAKRIEAEEIALETAVRVITSTTQEKNEQYSSYHFNKPENKIVIPPGVDVSRFSHPKGNMTNFPYFFEISRFLESPKKPMIIAISRADERKNILALVKAFGENNQLRDYANLVIVAGNRESISTLEKGARNVMTDLLLAIDLYDLHGSVAYPKHHTPEDIPDIYRLAAKSRGVFINPALTEPFGLTLIEAAASGLPVVATNDGGPREIISFCKNGKLIDPLDTDEMGKTLLSILKNQKNWKKYSKEGIKGVAKYFTWEGHVRRYIQEIVRVIKKQKKSARLRKMDRKLVEKDILLITDIDNTLIGERDALNRFIEHLKDDYKDKALGIATGRHLESTMDILKKWKVPVPNILITAVGTEIYYGPNYVLDTSWENHINYRWEPDLIYEVMEDFQGVKLQERINQRKFKISYNIDPDVIVTKKAVVKFLREKRLSVKVVLSQGAFLDILPIRASKGLAVRFLSMKWGIEMDKIYIAGDSGNDEDMLRGQTKGIVVGNYSPEIEHLRKDNNIYFAESEYADGIIEGLHYYEELDSKVQQELIDGQT
ncbi:HAD-IIB family hydrolase [candidate division KSB1 bacterium]